MSRKRSENTGPTIKLITYRTNLYVLCRGKKTSFFTHEHYKLFLCTYMPSNMTKVVDCYLMAN